MLRALNKYLEQGQSLEAIERRQDICKYLDPYLVSEVKKSAILYVVAFGFYILFHGVGSIYLLTLMGMTLFLCVWPLVTLKVASIAFRDISHRCVLGMYLFYGCYVSGGIFSPMIIFCLFMAAAIMPHTALVKRTKLRIIGFALLLVLVTSLMLIEVMGGTPEPALSLNDKPLAVALIIIVAATKILMIDNYHRVALSSYKDKLSIHLEKSRNLIENANLNVMAIDGDTLEICNYSSQAEIFKNYYENNTDKFKEYIESKIKQIKLNKKGSIKDQMTLNIDDEVFHFEIIITYYERDQNNRRVTNDHVRSEAFCLIYDVTNRVHYEKTIIAARDHAIELYKSKSSFLAQMSHELRTPLNAIIGFSEVMKLEMLGNVPTEYKEYSNNIHESGQYLLTIVNDILDMARIESGKYKPQIKHIDVATVIKQVTALVEATASDKKITIIPDAQCGDIENFYSDAQAIKQILVNLLSNCVKYCPEDSAVLLSVHSAPDHKIVFSVADNGHGFTEQVLNNFGSPFNIGKDHLTEGFKSTGLGLSITKGLTEVLQGEVKAFNAPKGGAVVEVTLPSLMEICVEKTDKDQDSSHAA
ncbi:MAG: HAMP domain-containing sensor histidine kinase [Pseudomonadota bacterium]